MLTSKLQRMALSTARPEPGSVWETDGIDWPVTTTAFGDAFIRACTAPVFLTNWQSAG